MLCGFVSVTALFTIENVTDTDQNANAFYIRQFDRFPIHVITKAHICDSLKNRQIFAVAYFSVVY